MQCAGSALKGSTNKRTNKYKNTCVCAVRVCLSTGMREQWQCANTLCWNNFCFSFGINQLEWVKWIHITVSRHQATSQIEKISFKKALYIVKFHGKEIKSKYAFTQISVHIELFSRYNDYTICTHFQLFNYSNSAQHIQFSSCFFLFWCYFQNI